MMTDMLAVGEQAGNMTASLDHIGMRYQKDMDRNITAFTNALEPILIVLIAAFPMALLGIIPQAIVADVAEQDAIVTGENREGMFFAARTFAMKFGQSLAMLVFTSLAVLGQPQVEGSNDLTASPTGLRIVAVVAVCFCVLGAVILSAYDEKKVMKTLGEKNVSGK
jgi:GPH family glycoside/pentoside/hexuronide:cation symporter